MFRAGLAVFAGMVLTAALAVAPATADQVRAARFEPVCGGKYARVACQVQKLVGGSYQAPMGWGATDLQASHGIPATSPHTGTIAIIDVGAYPTLENDLAVYRQQYGLPPCASSTGCFRQIDYKGGPALPPSPGADGPSIDEQIAVETSLDVDMASAACPGCRILEVQIPVSEVPTSDGSGAVNYDGYAAAFGTAVQTAVANGANSISISYGLPGSDSMVRGPVAAQLAQRGVAIVASSGDNGFQATQFLWPQALPTVTAVGGTELVKQGNTYSEGAWDGAGSSCVPGAAAAPGQPGDVTALCGGARTAVDVSAVADNLAIYTTYSPSSKHSLGWTIVAGTSASAPFIAGVYAASGDLRAVDGPNLLYRAGAGAFNDVISGTNGGVSNGRCLPPGLGSSTTFDGRLCGAGPGWDGPTGLGSPKGLLPL
ncbi:subtilase family serine protease [Amycolatopsis bartoniae]|uniref:Peptidase S8 n=1 Tax=Amycolatopsis bartoniae TaxID=941986 RepID=A0A8H9IQF9_9PSEU|nr:S8 family serine peptidase [Amycolatopsis bartoniae]MBB2939198.1 subtilase family serine protease [Amycolatopsis bartoniae]TVT09603.1 S8 family serine peptidase [Amycolatopsis bartoniae]GHF38271.1 peptidase S8 [Amycolatopsis bartoniae]